MWTLRPSTISLSTRRTVIIGRQQQQQQLLRRTTIACRILPTTQQELTGQNKFHMFRQYDGFPKISLPSPTGLRSMSSSTQHDNTTNKKKSIPEESSSDLWDKTRVNSFVGHSFPDFIEFWNRDTFRQVGYGLVGMTTLCGASAGLWAFEFASTSSFLPATTVFLGLTTAAYWRIGYQDMNQSSHAIRRNYPVLGNVRYILETIRPEVRQYIVESDFDGQPFDRMHRNQIYQRAKNVNDTIPFGTRRNVYDTKHEWACHSMYPKATIENDEAAKRAIIGTSEFGTTQLYDASVLNVSAMSFGAISGNAILALNRGAKLGNFYHNTGEGGVSKYHIQGGGDLVWNVGTGYFGCGSFASDGSRVFEEAVFQETVEECNGQIKMIEIKISQGAKPGHGGLLPKEKINPEIADARKLEYPPIHDCHSPAQHSAFSNPHQMIEFIASVREASGGLPVGIKLCVGQPAELAALVQAMVDVGNGPDFITVDGAEGGTGAAPPELTNSVGLPLEEGLVLARNLLLGAGLRDKVKLIGSGKVSTGFSLIRTIALGADITCAARAFMLSLGCIQALKCNSNKCPTGIATQNPELMYGLDPRDKTHRVYHFHRKTVKAAAGIAGVMGYDSISSVQPHDIMRRITSNEVRTLAETFPHAESGSLLEGNGPAHLQAIWEAGSNVIAQHR